MRLDEAMSHQMSNPRKKIIREPNKQGTIDVWFTVNNGILMVNTWELRANGHELSTRRAPFQTSPYNDWILID